MARALSQVYTIIRGSVGGLTYLANQFHQIVVRARTSPVNPSTPKQLIIRSAFSAASGQWKNLDQVNRDGWDVYAPSAVFSGPLGDYTVPGRSIMMSGYSLALYLANTLLVPNIPSALPPHLSGFAVLGNVTVEDPPGPAQTGFSLSVENLNPEDLGVMVNISLGFHPSRRFYKGPWDTRNSKGINVPPDTSGNVVFDNLTEGLRYFFRIKGVTIDGPHRITTEFYGSYIAVSVGP